MPPPGFEPATSRSRVPDFGHSATPSSLSTNSENRTLVPSLQCDFLCMLCFPLLFLELSVFLFVCVFLCAVCFIIHLLHCLFSSVPPLERSRLSSITESGSFWFCVRSCFYRTRVRSVPCPQTPAVGHSAGYLEDCVSFSWVP